VVARAPILPGNAMETHDPDDTERTPPTDSVPPPAARPRPRGRPRSEPVEVQRRRILDIARTEFSEHGYEATTVADVAQKAGVSRAVVYEAVGDKEALLLAVAAELSDELIAAIEEHFDAPEQAELPLADLVRDDLTWFMRQIRADPALVPITRLGTLLAAHGADPATRIRRRIEDRLTKLHIDRAREWNLPDRGESARVVASLVIAVAEAMAFRLDLDDDWPAEAAIAIAVEFAVGGYVNVEGAGRAAITAFDEMTGP
jgi:AcrR family transcriptional regulator